VTWNLWIFENELKIGKPHSGDFKKQAKTRLQLPKIPGAFTPMLWQAVLLIRYNGTNTKRVDIFNSWYITLNGVGSA
jgi:hypothetical protein